jgi:hypothetical protein
LASGRFIEERTNPVKFQETVEQVKMSTPTTIGAPTTPSTPSVANAFRTTLDLFETGLELMRQNLRRDRPDAAEQEIERGLHQWLRDRPGAEFGDCPGRRVDLSSKLG